MTAQRSPTRVGAVCGALLMLSAGTTRAEAQPASGALSSDTLRVAAVGQNASGARLRLNSRDSAVRQILADHIERQGDTVLISLPASLVLEARAFDLTLRMAEPTAEVSATFPPSWSSFERRRFRVVAEAPELNLRRTADGSLGLASESPGLRMRWERHDRDE